MRLKGISVFILSAAAVFAQATVSPSANFVTGQAARLVIGQSTFDAQDPNSSNILIGAAAGVAFGGNTLVIADSNQIGAAPNNNRVLIYPNVAGAFPRPTDPLTENSKCPVCVGQAAVVLGQPDFTTTTLNLTPSSSNLRQATAVATDGIHLV